MTVDSPRGELFDMEEAPSRLKTPIYSHPKFLYLLADLYE